MQTIAISNHKGGVGKTATAHALGAGLAGRGLRVLLLDTDPQGSLTRACGIADAAGRSLADVLGGAAPGHARLDDVIQELGAGLAIAPADIALAACELGLASRLGRELVLKRALATVASRFNVCLIDCPPSLGLLTVGALVAAGGVLIPTQPQAADMRGLKLFLDTLGQLKELNPDLQIMGILATFYDGRLTHHRQAVEAMRQAGLPLLSVLIGRSVRVAEAAGAGQSILDYDPGNPQAENYRQLTEEVITWLKNNSQI